VNVFAGILFSSFLFFIKWLSTSVISCFSISLLVKFYYEIYVYHHMMLRMRMSDLCAILTSFWLLLEYIKGGCTEMMCSILHDPLASYSILYGTQEEKF